MAMPVVKGEKSAGERFPGAVSTLSIEAMMQDRKALQAGTSHFLGQNFARAQEIKFQDQQGQEVYAWTTSWGVSTRLVGALLMTHSDDDGLVLPPRLAPQHVVILPIYRDADQRTAVLEYCRTLQQQLQAVTYDQGPLRVALDDRDLRGGEKNWFHIKRGVPLRLEIGPKEIERQTVFVGRRDTGEKTSVPRAELVATAAGRLDEIQQALFQRAAAMRTEHTRRIDSREEFRAFFTPENAEQPEIHGGFALCHWCDDPSVEPLLNELKVTIRCVPFDGDDEPGRCIFTGRPSRLRVVFAKAY
jgi:prolyl-tRNA synthetase